MKEDSSYPYDNENPIFRGHLAVFKNIGQPPTPSTPLPSTNPPHTEVLRKRTGGPYISGETLTSIITRTSTAHGETNPSLRAKVLTTHGAVKIWHSSSKALGDDLEVYLVCLNGTFQLRSRPGYRARKPLSHLELEIDATTGDILAMGSSSKALPYYVNPNLLDDIALVV